MGKIPYFMREDTVFWDDRTPLKRSAEKELQDVGNGFTWLLIEPGKQLSVLSLTLHGGSQEDWQR